MRIVDAILPEFDHEAGNTRRTLERVPEDKLTWKPHAKSFSMHDLAVHVATIPGWGVAVLKQDEFDVAPVGGEPYKLPQVKTSQELLSLFDKSIADMRAALCSTDDATMMKEWKLLAGGNTLFAMPRIACLRGFVMNHGVHHRAQLGVYLRLNDVPVPSIYGPSADENTF